MRKIQLLVLLAAVLLLIGYAIWNKLSQTYDFAFEFDSRFQQYIAEKSPEKSKLQFAGEEVPMQNKRVARRFRREMEINSYWNAGQALMLQRANYWLPQISPILKAHQIPDDFKYLAVVESMLLNVESPREAGGFWQLIPSTGRSLGLEINSEVDERYHPVKATVAACKYMKQARRFLGNWTSVAAAYNSGIGYLYGAQRRQGTKSVYELNLNRQTGGYIYRVLAFKELIEHQRAFGYKNTGNSLFTRPTKRIRVSSSVPDLTRFAATHQLSYRDLKTYNPWLMANTLTIKKPGTTYLLVLPVKKKGSVAQAPAIPPDTSIKASVADSGRASR